MLLIDNNFDSGTAEKLDEMIDGGDGDSNGRYRWHDDRYHLFRSIPVKHP